VNKVSRASKKMSLDEGSEAAFKMLTIFTLLCLFFK
jgi:hypothetical protein